MSQGRCVCGRIDSLPRVQLHQVACQPYAAAFLRGDKGLDPEAAYEEWSATGRKAARDEAHTESVADTDRRRSDMAARFATRDILEE